MQKMIKNNRCCTIVKFASRIKEKVQNSMKSHRGSQKGSTKSKLIASLDYFKAQEDFNKHLTERVKNTNS